MKLFHEIKFTAEVSPSSKSPTTFRKSHAHCLHILLPTKIENKYYHNQSVISCVHTAHNYPCFPSPGTKKSLKSKDPKVFLTQKKNMDILQKQGFAECMYIDITCCCDNLGKERGVGQSSWLPGLNTKLIIMQEEVCRKK